MNSVVNRASVMQVAQRFTCRLLSLVIIVSTIAVINPQTATADTSGTGACQQTFTKTGTGQVDVIESGGYCLVVFKNTGAVDTQVTYSWTRPTGVTAVDVLVVGGGGSGGARHGGGGGAGGFVQTDAYSISSAATVSIAVGAGGNGSTALYGTIGQASYFKSSSNGLTALGGGAGANAVNAGSGGSGGGAGAGQNAGGVTAQTQTSFSGTTINSINFGTSGAAGAPDSNNGSDANDYWAGGGGGGAAAAGQNPRSNGSLTTAFSTNTSATAVGGKGGDGKSVSWITPAIAAALSIGHTSSSTVYFAGGGGGGIGVDGQAGGPGGLGGGATGSRTEATGNPGSAFTGGGGGGSGFDDINKVGSTATVTAADAGDGGSGVVVLRYSMPSCSPASQSSGGYTILSFTNTTACSWSVPAGVSVADVLVVGGGGGGGINVGFGGGGGGVYYKTSHTVTSGSTASITVGSGGTAGTYINNPNTASVNHNGGDGGTSSLLIGATTFSATGGTGGKTYWGDNKCAGTSQNITKSSGGTGSGVGGTATTGGIGEAGNTGTAGGLGLNNSITGSLTNYSAGGGGGFWSASRGVAGGTSAGDGGNASGSAGGNAAGSRGGGGGGGAVGCGNGGAGGSGIIIVKYVETPSIALSSNAISAVIGLLSSYSITQGGGPASSYSIPSADSTALTAVGVSFSTSTGLLSGTPTGTLASRSITITATNSTGTTTATFSIVINNQSCSPGSATASGYTTLTFTSTTTCNWSVPAGVTSAEVLVVGGGGGGGFGNNGGGGGAGEVLVSGASATNSSGTITNIAGATLTPADVITVSIGTGGTSGAPTGSTAADATTAWSNNSATANFGGGGGQTSFGTVVARGGGGGGGNNGLNGGTGGSGGGSASGGTAGQVASNSPTGWTSFKNIGTAETAGNGGGAGGAGVLSSRGGSGVTALGRAVAGGGGGWGRLGGNNSLTDTVLGGNGRLGTGNWPYAGTAPNYTSAGVAGTGTGGGAGAPGGSGVITLRYVSTYTVTYTYNNATGGNSTPSTTFTPGGSAIALPTPTRTGFSFLGWYTLASGGSLVGAAGADYSPTGITPGITVQAQWISSNSSLSALSLSSGTLSPTFASNITSYNASVTNAIATGYIVTATKSDSSATIVQYRGATGAIAFDGSLSVGENIIRTLVTAQDGVTTTTYTLTVTRSAASRTITIDDSSFTSTYAMTATAPTLTSTASVGSGTKSYTSSTLAVCTVNSSSGLVAFVSAGTCLITASITADATYASATSPSISFTTTLVTQTITWSPTTALLTTASPATPSVLATALGGATISYSVTSAGATSCTVNSSTAVLTFTTAGSCTVRATSLATANYAAATKDVTFVITQATYTITYAYNNATGGNSNATSLFTVGGDAITLPIPTRTNFTFEGWYTESAFTNLLGATLTPAASGTLYARWTQNSLRGLTNPVRTATTKASNVGKTTFGFEIGSSSVTATIPAGSLPNNTDVDFYILGVESAQALVDEGKEVIISMVVAWLAPDGTVPDIDLPKAPISLLIENTTIKKGMRAYAIVNGDPILVGTATEPNKITVLLTRDPEVVIVTTKPDAPTGVTATSNGNAQSVISWSAPAVDGGSAITGYTVTSSPSVAAPAGCTNTTNLSCTFTGLTNGTIYTFTVTATNEKGTSDASTAAYGAPGSVSTTFTRSGTAIMTSAFEGSSVAAVISNIPTGVGRELAYQWFGGSDANSLTAISLATASTYTPKASDRSLSTQIYLSVRVVATISTRTYTFNSPAIPVYTYPNATGGSVTAPSPAARGTYTSGKYKVGQTVIGHPWQVTGTPWSTLNYQWWICNTSAAAANVVTALTATPATCLAATSSGNSGTATRGGYASSPTSIQSTNLNDLGNYGFAYVVPDAAAGKFLTFTATLSNEATTAQGTVFTFTQSRTMNSGIIQTTPGLIGTPNITGTARVGGRLTAASVSATLANGNATGKISYQWLRCNTSSEGCVNISGATRTTYTAVSDDQGKYLRVFATARNNASVIDATTAISATSVRIS